MNTSDLCTVRDPAALADIVGTLIVHFGGSDAKAAEKIGISQPTLNRLRRGAVQQIARTTAAALERAVNALAIAEPIYAEMVADLRNAIVSPETQQYFAAYRAWCEERKCRWQESECLTWKVGAFMQLEPNFAPSLAQAPLRQEFMRMLWQRVHQEFPEVFRKFRDEMQRRGVDETRQEVAIIRIIEPLLEATQSAYIERSYSELTERERRDFIDAGIKRESILLDREPALTRARRIAEQGADTFAKPEGERALYAHERLTPVATTPVGAMKTFTTTTNPDTPPS